MPTSDRGWRQRELVLVAATAAVFVALPKPPTTIVALAVFIPACSGAWAAAYLV